MKDKLRVGIVGTGRGVSFIRHFTTIAETEVTAICDTNEERLNGGMPVEVPDFRKID